MPSVRIIRAEIQQEHVGAVMQHSADLAEHQRLNTIAAQGPKTKRDEIGVLREGKL